MVGGVHTKKQANKRAGELIFDPCHTRYTGRMTKNWFQKMQDGFRHYFSDRPTSDRQGPRPGEDTSRGAKQPHQLLARLETSPESFFLSALDLTNTSFSFSTHKPLVEGERLQLDAILPRLGLTRLSARVTQIRRAAGSYHGKVQLDLLPQQTEPWRNFLT